MTIPSPPGPGADGEAAGPLIADLITKELDAEQSVTASLQSRGLAVISSSGTLVTLLFGLSAVATTAQHFKLPAAAKPPLYLAAVLLVRRSGSGHRDQRSPGQQGDRAAVGSGRCWSQPYWDYPVGPAQQEVARTQLAAAEAARADNHVLGRYLLTAIILEIAGIASTMAAVIALIAKG